ncbi:hypothetical protein D9Q98_005799 [Chlorella vulgaris]|uniref:Reverse transcriptase domain-containing protein n=2 Tax=Chlorella vulgaris TaxID=3077 RepID=A0A9D4YWG6_CHLVU|nr:hypothetical protein D9Q98_005799 [Chlorella vulgaris]
MKVDKPKARAAANGSAKKQKHMHAAAEVPDAPANSGRNYTVSIAVAASCIENAQNLELATLLAGQVARAAAIFNVDEVVVLDDAPDRQPGHVSSAAALFARVLQFMETPQYLKKALIPMHPDLKYAGVLPPLDAPHHLRSTEWGLYREGVVRHSAKGKGSWVDVGLDQDAHIPQAARQGVRLTLDMGWEPLPVSVDGQQVLQAQLALPTDPREKAGLYWGYITRIAPSLQAMVNQCPFPGGYDMTVGTSERGECTPPCQLQLGPFRHLLIVFGGPHGLEYALQHDDLASQHNCPSELFDRYLNTCFDQGSRTIRSEEAILISMAFVKPAISTASTAGSSKLSRVDNCFILRALAERARSRGVKLYLCAVDFEKAFDSVDRPLLWAALQRAGIGGTMLQAIQAMYADVPVCVRTEEGLSGCFQSVLGVKQGCPLSPLLFGIFLDDFEGHIQQLGDAAALPQLAGRTVPPLLFADDMFLLSSSASGLQAQLHALQDYCNAKKLTVNAKKTQVMIMRPGGGSGNGKLAAGESFEYAGLPLEVASSTKYLGLTFSQLSKQHGFASCADVLAKAGRQAMFAMRRRAWELGACLVEQQCMLFDVFVKPVLSYGCELWGVDVLLRPDCSSVERVHRWFCRRVQGLPKQVTAAISLAELGRQPLQSFWIQQLVRFWNRLQNSAADEDRVLGWAFKDNLELMREGGDLAAGSACWSRRWLHVLQSAPPASGTLEWLTELDEAAVIERAAAAYLRKRVQGLPKQVTAAISLAELGRQPLQSFWIQQLVRFWNRLQNSAADEDRVLGHPRMAH